MYDSARMDEFIDKYLDEFTLIIPLEQFETGLLMLKAALNWQLVDITYTKVYDSHTSGGIAFQTDSVRRSKMKRRSMILR